MVFAQSLYLPCRTDSLAVGKYPQRNHHSWIPRCSPKSALHRLYLPIESPQILPSNELPYGPRRVVLIDQPFHVNCPHHHLLSIYCLYSHLQAALLASVHIYFLPAPVSSLCPAIYIYHIPPIRVTLLLPFFHTFVSDGLNVARPFKAGDDVHAQCPRRGTRRRRRSRGENQ